MALASLDARAPPPPLLEPPSKYYAKVVIKGKPHFAPFLHSLRRRYSRRGGFYVLCRGATGEVRRHKTAARCRRHVLFCKIKVRPQAYWSYPLWCPCFGQRKPALSFHFAETKIILIIRRLVGSRDGSIYNLHLRAQVCFAIIRGMQNKHHHIMYDVAMSHLSTRGVS